MKIITKKETIKMIDFVLNNVRADFTAQVFKAQAFEGDEPKYGITLLIPKNDPQVRTLVDAMKKAAIEKFGDLPANLYYALRDGDKTKDTQKYPEFKDSFYIQPKTKRPPQVVDLYGNRVTEEDDELYPGRNVCAWFDLFGYDSHGRKGVSAQLKGIQVVEGGERIGVGAANLPFKFKSADPRSVPQDEDDPFAGLNFAKNLSAVDDDIPF